MPDPFPGGLVVNPRSKIRDRAQILGRLFDAFGDMGEIFEQRGAKRAVEVGGTANRIETEIEVSESHGQRIPHLMRDHDGLAGELPECLSGGEPATRPVLSGGNGAKGKSGELE